MSGWTLHVNAYEEVYSMQVVIIVGENYDKSVDGRVGRNEEQGERE